MPDPYGGPPSPSHGAPGDAPNVLRQYVAVLRRRWKWIVLGLIVGLAAGYASTLLQKEKVDPTKYYKATNTLILNGFDPSGQGSTNVPNLQQAAFLVRSADVTNEVATTTGLSVETVNNQVAAFARSDVLAIDVTAISTDPQTAVTLADTAAGVLNNYLASDATNQRSATVNEVAQKMDELEARVNELDAQIAERPPESADILKATRDGVYNQYRLAVEEFQGLANQDDPTGALSTLQTATPVQINARAYNQRLQDNLNARGSANVGVVTAQASTSNETDLGTSGPVSKSTRTAIGGATGLVLGLITAFVVEAWDDRLRRRDRVERVTGLPVIAEVPVLSKKQRSNTFVPAVDAPRSRAAERFRAVRTSVMFAAQQAGPLSQPVGPGTPTGQNSPKHRTPVVMVTSPNPSEGKTTTVVNLAAVFGDSGMRTLLIDCDYRKPSVGKYLAPVPLADRSQACETRLSNVWYVPAPRNTENWGEIVAQLRTNVETLRDDYDIVLLDTPPMLATNDATDLLAVADTVLLVLRAGQTRSGPAEGVANLLGRFRADVLGIVLNGCNSADMDSGYGYSYGYYGGDGGYFVDETTRRKPSAAPVSSTANGSTNGNGNGNGIADGNGSADRPSVVAPSATTRIFRRT